MKQSISRLVPRFSTGRMVREYVDRYYLTAGRTPAGEAHGD
jgi:hypothetical protein